MPVLSAEAGRAQANDIAASAIKTIAENIIIVLQIFFRVVILYIISPHKTKVKDFVIFCRACANAGSTVG